MATNINQNGLPSPVASTNSPAPSNISSSGGRSGLPTARRQPLKPGSLKEIALINYIDDKVLRITRRYGKKFVEPDSENDDAPGYTDIQQVILDIEPLIDLAWASGTRKSVTSGSRMPANNGETLVLFGASEFQRVLTRIVATVQIPYLLSFAGTIMSYMAAFPFSTQVLRITKKIDTAFASLLRGTAGEAIRAHPVSTTEKVRIKSLVEETKMVAIHVASTSGLSTHVEEDSDDETDDDADADNDDGDISTALAISRMYKSTIEILGDALVQ